MCYFAVRKFVKILLHFVYTQVRNKITLQENSWFYHPRTSLQWHHMKVTASQIIGNFTVSIGIHQRKRQSSVALVLCKGYPTPLTGRWESLYQEYCGGALVLPSKHYSDVIMVVIASQITSLTIIYSTVYSDADQRKHQSSASLAFVRGIHRWPVNSPHKGPVTRKMFAFDDVIMRKRLCFVLFRLYRQFLMDSCG